MLGLPPSFDSNGSKKTTLKSFTSGASSGPLNPRVSYLLKHLNSEKINDIMNRMNRGEITGEEMIKLLEKESNSCLEGMKQEERMEEEVMEDEDEEEEEEEGRKKIEEDGEMGMTLRLGDQEKPGVVKRPQSSLVACEVESKKPRVTQALGFQGGEPVPAEM